MKLNKTKYHETIHKNPKYQMNTILFKDSGIIQISILEI